MASIFNAFIAYQFIKTLTTDWSNMDAYKLGIVDKNGNQLKKTSDLTTAEEKNSYTIFHRLVFNLKRILEKFPMGKTRIASYAAAFALLKENADNNFTDQEIELMEKLLCDYINQCEIELYEHHKHELAEEIANSIGNASSLAGLGSTPSTFAGMKVFPVKSSTYVNLFKGKKKYKRWDKYISAEESSEIRNYIKKNPRAKVVIKDESIGTMMILYRNNEI